MRRTAQLLPPGASHEPAIDLWHTTRAESVHLRKRTAKANHTLAKLARMFPIALARLQSTSSSSDLDLRNNKALTAE